jgi:uncharacterized protein YdiU (UPF0061 family)
MQRHGVDHTSTFRRLSQYVDGDSTALDPPFDPPFDEIELRSWIDRWHVRLAAEGCEPGVVADRMNAVNPIYVPRNHLVEDALDAATAGDLGPFERLLGVITNPFDARPGHERYADPAPESFTRYFRTFCGT